ncbi:MAG: DUF1727 domain-containing protein [Oscillospiraceae bacterium]|nr:DUF1727 domain-containing protein [Oscillospiraceae bacterium]
MRKLRFLIALWASKACLRLLRLLKRNATCTPGKIALAIDKKFLGGLRLPKTVIAVTGTNGKTTVSNLLTDILTQNGYRVTNNSLGSNIQAGIASALLEDSDLLGRAKKDIAVLEVDERSSLLVYPYVKPDFLVCNNIMRDSIKRNAHTEFISYIISSALPEKTHLILNGDDLNASTLAPQCENRTYFGVEAEKPEESAVPFISDVVYCPDCGGTLQAEYLRYNHIGRMYCPDCGKKSPERSFVVTDIDRKNNTFTVRHPAGEDTYSLISDNIVNVYNFCGTIALLTGLGLSYEQISRGFDAGKIVKSRFDQVRCGGRTITSLMAKGQNPIACARCFDYIAHVPGENKGLIISEDDVEDNNGNSESTCWLYDCDYSYLQNKSIRQIVFAGPRCYDHLLRARLAGVDPAKITLEPVAANAASALDLTACQDIYLLHDMYRAKDTAVVKKALIEKLGGADGEN